jgi:hypothetical protein
MSSHGEFIDEIALAGVGRLPRRLRSDSGSSAEFSFVRELTPADLSALLQAPREAPHYPQLESLRETHHALARALASGMSKPDAAATTGHSYARVVYLSLYDRGFIELISHYRGVREAQFADAAKRLATLGFAATEVIQERLEESPDAFTNKDLREIAEFAFDRSVAPAKGLGKGNANAPPVNVSVTFVSPKAPEVEAPRASPMIDLIPEKDPAP